MKISVSKPDLHYALQVTGRATTTRGLYILGCLLLSTDGDRLRVTGGDLETTVTVWIPAEVTWGGQRAIPAKLLGQLVASLTGDRVELWDVPGQGDRQHDIEVRCEGHKSRVNGMPSEDYPAEPTMGETSFAVPAKALSEAIGQVAYAAATDNVRPTLVAVLVRLADRKLTLAAADGFRLAVRTLQIESTAAAEALVPATALRELGAVLAKREGDVVVSIESNRVVFRCGDLLFVSRVIEGTFPNYQQIIPTSRLVRVSADAKRLLGAVRGAHLFSQTDKHVVRLAITPGSGAVGSVRVSGRGVEIGETEEEISASVETAEGQGPLVIAFDGRYLSEALAAMPSDSVYIDCTVPSRPGVIRPAGDDSYIAVLMPMFIEGKDKAEPAREPVGAGAK